MVLLTILLITYICAINYYAFRYLRAQTDKFEDERHTSGADGKLLLIAAMGGAITLFTTMFIYRYRLESMMLMIALPLLSVVNIYCFYLGFRGIFFVI